jgi:MFS transporter, SP family, sugar:H+ symporter
LIFIFISPSQTKGLSLEQIDVMYQNTTPLRSLEYRRRLLANDIHPSDPEAGKKLGSDQEKTSDDNSRRSDERSDDNADNVPNNDTKA